VQSVSPGIVRTGMREASGLTDPYENNPYLEPQDVADAVLYALGTPPHVQVSFEHQRLD
jgi:NADP+-dependent farnesol dehydrogenase